MIIDELEIIGFKSFKEKTILKNFGRNFNAITGNNGCGKSNIFDSICFVLGLSNINLMRVSKIQDLIYSTKNFKLDVAQITLKLQKIPNKRLCEERFYARNSASISREIYKNGKNRYSLNGTVVSPGKILNFLCSINLNITTAHFLVRQGNITGITLMSNKELLNLFENSIGTKLYEIKKKTAIGLITKKKKRLFIINQILNKKIKPTIKNVQSMMKKMKKIHYFRILKQRYDELNGRLNFIGYIDKKLKIKYKQFKLFKDNLSKSIYLEDIFRSKKIVKNYKTEKFSENLINFLKSKNYFTENLKKLTVLNRYLIVLQKFKKKLTTFRKTFEITIKATETKYLKKKFYFNRALFKNLFIEELKYKLIKFPTIKFFTRTSEINQEFLNYLESIILKKNTNFFEDSFKTHKIKKFNFLYELFNFLIFYKFQNNIFVKEGNFSKYSKKILLQKKLSFLKEDMGNFLFCIENFDFKNSEERWYSRKFVLGKFSSLIQLKSTKIITIYGHLLSEKIDFLMVIKKSTIRKHNEEAILQNQDKIILSKIGNRPIIEEKFHHKVFRILSFLSFSKILWKEVGYCKEFYLLAKIKYLIKFRKILKTKNFKFVTFFGEIFIPYCKFLVAGDFFSDHSTIFNKKKIEIFMLRWLRLVLIIKKIIPYRNFNLKLKNIKIKSHIKMENFFIEKIKKNCFQLPKKNIFIKKNLFSFLIKKDRFIIERKFFLRKINTFNWNTRPFPIISFTKSIYSSLFYKRVIEKKIHRNLYFGKKVKKINMKVLFFMIKLFEFSDSFSNLQKNIRKISYILKYKSISDINSCIFYEKVRQLTCFDSIKSTQSKLNVDNFSDFTNFFKKKWFFFDFEIKGKYKKFMFKSLHLLQQFTKSLDIEYLERISINYEDFLFKRIKIEKDRLTIERIISKLEIRKKEIMMVAFQKVNYSFGIFFKAMVPLYRGKLSVIKDKDSNWTGIQFLVSTKQEKKSTSELSGGQRSILALSLIFSIMIFKAAPFYILDEIDAALDFCHVKNISKLMLQNFSFVQFIIISLKKQVILNAEVVFEVKQIFEKSIVTRLKKIK